MAKVYPIDRGIIDRTQGFLMRNRDKDGTWSNIGATHGETIASMGNPKLLLTSYVTWSLLESGYDRNQLKVSVDYIRNNIEARRATTATSWLSPPTPWPHTIRRTTARCKSARSSTSSVRKSRS